MDRHNCMAASMEELNGQADPNDVASWSARSRSSELSPLPP